MQVDANSALRNVTRSLGSHKIDESPIKVFEASAIDRGVLAD
jgi:hypothetical protein